MQFKTFPIRCVNYFPKSNFKWCVAVLVEIEHYSVAYFDHVTLFERCSAKLLLRVSLIHTAKVHEYLISLHNAYEPRAALNRSSALQHFEGDNMVKRSNRIMFNFYWDSHVCVCKQCHAEVQFLYHKAFTYLHFCSHPQKNAHPQFWLNFLFRVKVCLSKCSALS